ncbi:MAG TPA: hypothetical protein VFX16_28775 [Pseudonocardiaceae bacterium]|nr:hypothetical protein [Pseudonocardiaceae bacterium]
MSTLEISHSRLSRFGRGYTGTSIGQSSHCSSPIAETPPLLGRATTRRDDPGHELLGGIGAECPRGSFDQGSFMAPTVALAIGKLLGLDANRLANAASLGSRAEHAARSQSIGRGSGVFANPARQFTQSVQDRHVGRCSSDPQ